MAYDGDAVGHRQELVMIRRDEDHAVTGAREGIDQPVDGNLGTDVDPLGGLIENEQLGTCEQPPADDDFLLVSAGEQVDGFGFGGRADFEILDQPLACLGFAPKA